MSTSKINPTCRHLPERNSYGHREGLGSEEFEIRTATLQEPEQGLTNEVLDNTDVLVWWGHARHNDVLDEIVERAHRRALDGMGAPKGTSVPVYRKAQPLEQIKRP